MAGRKSPTYRLGNFLYFVKDTCICSASAEGGQAIQILENAGVILRVVDQELDYTRETGGPTEVRFLDLKAFSLNSLRYRGLAYLAVCPSLLPREVSALQGKSGVYDFVLTDFCCSLPFKRTRLPVAWRGEGYSGGCSGPFCQQRGRKRR